MLDNPKQIADFGKYQAAGGFKRPDSYETATSNMTAAQSHSEALKAAVDPELDYNKDGIQELPQLITQLAGECDAVTPASTAWNEYLDMAATPDDLMQVAIGVDVLCKMAGQPNDKPAASIRPITHGQAVTDNKGAIDQVSAKRPGIVALMAKINVAITPSTGPMGGTLPPPPLPADLKQQAMAMIAELRPLRGKVQATSTIVSDQANAAKVERAKALKAFSEAVSFTILDNNRENPPIKDAINEIYPH